MWPYVTRLFLSVFMTTFTKNEMRKSINLEGTMTKKCHLMSIQTCMTFFCGAQNNKFLKMSLSTWQHFFATKFQYCYNTVYRDKTLAINHSMKIWYRHILNSHNESQLGPMLFWTPLTFNVWTKTAKGFFQISSFVFHHRVIQVCNDTPEN